MVVRRSPILRRLIAAEVIGPLGDTVATVSVILHLQAERGTGAAVAAVLFAEAIPTVLAPIAGTFADRARDPRRLVATSALLQAAVMAAVAASLPALGLAGLAALLFVRAALDTASSPVLSAIVPAVVDDADLERANGAIVASRELGMMVGPPIAGLLFAAVGARPAFVIDALTFLVVVPLVLALPARPIEIDGPGVSWGRDMVDGVRVVWHRPRLRAVAIGFWVAVFLSAPDDLVLPFLGDKEFGAGPFAIGLLMAGASVGLVAAAPFIARIAARIGTPAATFVAGLFVAGAANTLTAFAPIAGLAFAAQVLRGGGVAILDAAGVRPLIQREVPPALAGRVFANMYGGVSAAAALGYVPAGFILDATSPRVAFAIVGIGGLVGAVLAAAMLRRARVPA